MKASQEAAGRLSTRLHSNFLGAHVQLALPEHMRAAHVAASARQCRATGSRARLKYSTIICLAFDTTAPNFSVQFVVLCFLGILGLTLHVPCLEYDGGLFFWMLSLARGRHWTHYFLSPTSVHSLFSTLQPPWLWCRVASKRNDARLRLTILARLVDLAWGRPLLDLTGPAMAGVNAAGRPDHRCFEWVRGLSSGFVWAAGWRTTEGPRGAAW